MFAQAYMGRKRWAQPYEGNTRLSRLTPLAAHNFQFAFSLSRLRLILSS